MKMWMPRFQACGCTEINKVFQPSYAANVFKACLCNCKRKYHAGFNFSASSRFANCVAINNSAFINGKLYISSLLSSRRSQQKYSEFSGYIKTRFSTGNISLASELIDDREEIHEFAKESLIALTIGPPEELIQNLGEENRQKLNLLWMELKEIQQKGYIVPKEISLLQWREAMTRETRSQKIKFWRYLSIKEFRKEKKILKTRANLQEREKARTAQELKNSIDPSFIESDHGASKNTIFLPFCNNNMNVVYNSWQCQAIQFGQSIVIDLGFDDLMSKWEAVNCAQQIINLYGFNKASRQPFHLHLCNASPDNRVLKYIEQYIPNLYSHMCMITVAEKNYLDVFPKEKLVYLTPDCKNELMDFDHDAVYIIGGIVDKGLKQTTSMTKAKKEGISMACLPLDHYLTWGQGTKSLTLNQVMKIMHDIKNTGGWNIALKHVPIRKLKMASK